MDFLREWEAKLGIKISCSQVPSHPFVQPLWRALYGPCSSEQLVAIMAASTWSMCVALCIEISNCHGCCMYVVTDLARWITQEKEPMGTAGPLALARDILDDGSGNPFFVLNRCGFN